MRKGSGKLYQAWCDLKQRCYNPKTHNYHRYGGRGITVCDEWRNSFDLFRDWAIQNGYLEGLQIDRENNNGNYEPDNCRWVTCKINSRNSSSVKLSLEKANEIREIYAKRELSYRQVGLLFGVGKEAVGDIVRNKTWT